jgi:DNA-binding transcriptional ArsR family regulator
MEINDAIQALQSLAQETRLNAFRMLVTAGPEGLRAGELAAGLGVPAPTLSFHLNHLRHAGLIDCRRRGRSLWYSVAFGQVQALLAFLMENCCQGRPEICSTDTRPACCTGADVDFSDACCE